MRKKSLPIVCAVFLVIAMTVQFIVSYQREKTDLMLQMEYKMELAQKDFIFEMYDMHEAADEITHFFPEFEDNTDDLYALLETVLWHYPGLYCCYITFLPECSPHPGQWSGPTAFRVKGDSIITYDAKDHIPYVDRDWYIGALKSDEEGYWSLPYKDGTHADPVFTYSQKVYDSEEKLVGVTGADYTLRWTEQLLEDVKPYDDAVCQLYSTDGTLIVGSGDATRMHDMIVFEKVLSPTDMRLVITVPKCHIRQGIAGVSLITLSVLLSGILIIGLLLRHIRKEQDAFTRMEMANKVIEKEMQIAHDIQMGILKGEKLMDEGMKGVELEAKLIPMREVGGDLYDFHREKDKLWFIIGDVSGKGVPAAMFMSAAVNLFRAAGAHSDSPREIMEKMNAVLSENNSSLTFVTAFIGCLNIPTGELLYCNAGHCMPLRVSGLSVSGLEVVPNIPLGFDGKFKFVEQGCMLGQDETLVLYTDGVTEARNAKREMIGMERWSSIVESGKWKVESLLDEVKNFMGKAEPADDITLMTIRKTSAVETLTLRVENRIDHWPEMCAALHNYALCAGMEPRALKKTEVAIEEAVVNIVNYSQAEWMELIVDCRFEIYDGEFQVNFSTNSYMGRIKIFNMLGCCPYDQYDNPTEFSPINETARAIVLLATTPKECTVFQPYNTHTRLLGNVLQVLDKLGTQMQFVEPEAFGMAIQQAALDPQKAPLLTTMLAYQNIAHGQPTQIVDRNNAYTSQVLLRLGFRWTEPDNEYIGRMLTAISQLGFFDV